MSKTAGDLEGTVLFGFCDTILLPTSPDASKKIIILDCISASLDNFPCPEVCYNGTANIFKHFPFLVYKRKAKQARGQKRTKRLTAMRCFFLLNFHIQLIPNHGCSNSIDSNAFLHMEFKCLL